MDVCNYVLTVRSSWYRALPFFLLPQCVFSAQWIQKSPPKDLGPSSLHLFKVLKRKSWGKSMEEVPGHHVWELTANCGNLVRELCFHSDVDFWRRRFTSLFSPGRLSPVSKMGKQSCRTDVTILVPWGILLHQVWKCFFIVSLFFSFTGVTPSSRHDQFH